jgi:hypothetical protein
VFGIVAATGASADGWKRTGVIWGPAPPPPPPPKPVVNQQRVEEQIEKGCGSGDIRFADTAMMRGTAGALAPWPKRYEKRLRKLSAVAAIADNPDTAQAALIEALETPDLDQVQRAVLVNQRILTALQFGQDGVAASLIESAGFPGWLSSGLLSDRLFWSVLVGIDGGATPDIWRKTLDPALEQAWIADPLSFQVRVWRVISWVEGFGTKGSGSCRTRMANFSARVLDVSEASACPLMLGHFVAATDRHFQSRSDDNLPVLSERAAWRKFAVGISAVISGETRTIEAARSALEQSGGIACSGAMAGELKLLAERFE